MAKQAAGAVATAVIAGIADRALTTVIRKLRSGSRPAATDEKLQRLETLVLKLRSVIQVSEKHAIKSSSLLEWRDRLRESAAEAGAVVHDFQRRAREDGGEAAAASTSASASAPGQQQPAGALYFTRSALSGMAQRVRDVTRRLFSTDEDMKKLDGALEKMERLSPDMTQFLLTLQLEVSPKRRRRSAPTRPPRLVMNAAECMQLKVKRKWMEEDQPDGSRKAATSSETETTQLASAAADEAWEDREREARMLAGSLQMTLLATECYIRCMDNRDMGGLEWLAEWASVIREAVERGKAVLQTLRPGSDVIHEAGGGALEEDGELYSFVRAVRWWTQKASSRINLMPSHVAIH
ncbi:hypothetical protein BDA96_01G034900 [Sorghum bicolor]|uniref:Rx N-terminal domain-containing protein n=2 Tax=Sorghum bicolor TaxID=4558 RepID=A0A921RVY5_SORBI|nr:hypothetical protein BDA96_01G034900 [Sorghum bicolor]OQU90717.1 hypothetical protein SORBI_3001G033701 [Sorghum bicolor]